MIKRTMQRLRQSCVFRVLILSALSVCACLAQDGTERVIAQVQSRYNGAHTLSVRFTEEAQAGRRSRPAESGCLTLEKQGKMRWDYVQPPGKVFVSDGKSVYLYTPAENRVEKIPIRNTEDLRAPLAFLLGRLDLHKEFRDFRLLPVEAGEAADVVAGAASSTGQPVGSEGRHWLSADAKNDRVPYEHVEMLVTGDGSIHKLRIVGRDGSNLFFVFSDERLNPPVNQSMFRFTVPPGAQVVDGMELEGEGR